MTSTATGKGQAPAGAHGRIEIEHVEKYYTKAARHGRGDERVHALRDVNLTVDDGEFVSLLGPSGCGKTTLLKALDGLVSIEAGEIRVGGRAITGPGRDRAFVFQNFGLFPWRNVLGNVVFPLEAAGRPKAEREEVARRFIEMVGLSKFIEHHPHELSGGMQQRVGIARALATDPQILLMDEPFGALDAQTRELMQVELLQIWEKTGKTVVFVTHSVDEAIFLSKRIAVFTPHPGTIKEILTVPFGYPRTEGNVKLDPRFAEMRHEIWEMLRGAVTPAFIE
ncbi:MAG TPA: ABC transporter ATP-binding protein [Candidatus Limnocylindrales bacterium]|jgi:NitT/TauT family transport system ATP-binding protein|nr:ABC transporter ATP-binding protein [Candidatus Limnocylindrales bacterium]